MEPMVSIEAIYADPLRFAELYWPHVQFYDKQREIIYSVERNPETFVSAANMVGKDFVTAFIVLSLFLRFTPARIVTTSVRDDHLRILWGEINRFIDTAAIPLTYDKGGPLFVNQREIRRIGANGDICKISYLIGMVSAKGEGMAGHHATNTLLVGDEASGIDDEVYTQGAGWAKRMLFIGNPNPCGNFFKRYVKAGDLPGVRKVFKIPASDSPNVALGLRAVGAGREPTGEIIVPGVISWAEYQKRRATWDEMRQSIGLDAEFYEGANIQWFPQEWLEYAMQDAQRPTISQTSSSYRRWMGCDSAEGGDRSAWVIVDRYGVIDLISKKTPDTTEITRTTTALMQQHKIAAQDVMFDRGGGGKQHADRLRIMGHDVRTVGFGEAPSNLEPRRGLRQFDERLEATEDRGAYKDRRSEMFWCLRSILEPGQTPTFTIPRRFAVLFEQMAPIPLRYDERGRIMLIPKNRKGNIEGGSDTLVGLIGYSPDELDALVMAVDCMLNSKKRVIAGVG